MCPPGMPRDATAPIKESACPGNPSCHRISIASRPPKIKKKNPVKRYCRPITLWSVENTHLRRKPCGGWWTVACDRLDMRTPLKLARRLRTFQPGFKIFRFVHRDLALHLIM